MHKIYHISRFTLQTGMYDIKAAANSMLIRICDPGMSHATPFSDFKKVVDMEFLDAEDSCGFAESDKFSMLHAQQLHFHLFTAYKDQMDVYVQCEQGVSRSAAIAKVAQLGGFVYMNTGYAKPNERVMQKLGYCFDVNVLLPH